MTQQPADRRNMDGRRRRQPGCYVTGLIILVAACPVTTWADAQQTGKVYQPGDVYLTGSRVYTHVGKTGFGHEHAVEGRLKSGILHLDGESPGGELVFDMTSFNADTPAARAYIGLEGQTDASTQKKVNDNMLGSAVLNIEHFPTAKFSVTAIARLAAKSQRGLPQYKIDGKFTLQKATRPISIVADAEEKGDWIRLRGGFSILQTDYGITPYSAAFGAVGVADKLTIWGDLWIATREVTVANANASTKE